MAARAPFRPKQAGYSLMEVMIATAIASMIVILVLSAARNLDRALARSERSLGVANTQVLDQSLLEQLGRATRPGYVGAGDPFLGDAQRVSGVAFLTDFSPPEGDPYTLELREADEVTELVLTLRETQKTLARLAGDTYRFEFTNDFGNLQESWGTPPLQGLDREMRSRFPFAAPLPRAIWIVGQRETDRSAAIIVRLESHAFPPPRPEDVLSIVEGL